MICARPEQGKSEGAEGASRELDTVSPQMMDGAAGVATEAAQDRSQNQPAATTTDRHVLYLPYLSTVSIRLKIWLTSNLTASSALIP